ncbi:MAG: hypothetical protein SF069_00805 [Phycisphaerae bacterium]|nr:hypothetical protein [Phycisphaerae bacterium]
MLVVLLASACLGGCTQRGGGLFGQPEQAAHQEHPLLVGVPLPRGFRLVPERSSGVDNPRMRLGKYAFTGRTSPDELFAFFTRTMGPAGYTLRQRGFDNGLYSMVFTSAYEELRINIRRVGMGTDLSLEMIPVIQDAPAQPQ